MRRKIELYIGGRRADLNDQALVLFNYSLTDIQKPTAVKNAYSKQITLPGTPANDAIFSGSYRVDRTVGPGQFNPLERTAFVIYDEKGTILEQGYAKLDKVTSKGESRTYAVTLYGGLGSFFYGLSYKSNGEKMTLADLQYLSPLLPFDDELDFTMTADEMKANWVRVADGTVEPITFVPAYEGTPDGDFDAQKAVVKCADVGLPASQTDGDTTYTAQQGGTALRGDVVGLQGAGVAVHAVVVVDDNIIAVVRVVGHIQVQVCRHSRADDHARAVGDGRTHGLGVHRRGHRVQHTDICHRGLPPHLLSSWIF